jgi:hypothetical protein
MPRWFSASVLCFFGSVGLSSFSGCTLPTSSSDAGASSVPTVTGDSGTLSATASGTNCGTDPTTNVTLCTGISSCPTVVVDENVFPECGFDLTGTGVYLVCLCSGYLCPIGQGQPTTCAEAAALLQASNEGTACGEASNGQCALVSSGTGTTGTTGSTGTTTTDAGSGSGCDETCESMCAGEPDCIQLCGC